MRTPPWVIGYDHVPDEAASTSSCYDFAELAEYDNSRTPRLFNVPPTPTWRGSPMSALGQKQTWPDVCAMSALTPIADMCGHGWNVRFVPDTDIYRIDTVNGSCGCFGFESHHELDVHQMKTALCDRLGIELPIIQAPMGGAVGPNLAAAVSNAGGLGMLVLWRADTDTIRRQIQETRALTSRPFGVNLNLDFPQEERLEACLEERVPVISFFWRDRHHTYRVRRLAGQL